MAPPFRIRNQEGDLRGGDVVREAINGETLQIHGATSVSVVSGPATESSQALTFTNTGEVVATITDSVTGTTITQRFAVFGSGVMSDPQLAQASSDTTQKRLILRALCNDPAYTAARLTAAVAHDGTGVNNALIARSTSDGISLRPFGGF